MAKIGNSTTYKVGDVVKIRSDLQPTCKGPGITEEMCSFGGKSVKIRGITILGYYKLE